MASSKPMSVGLFRAILSDECIEMAQIRSSKRVYSCQLKAAIQLVYCVFKPLNRFKNKPDLEADVYC